jgi:hypothetical protein
MNLKSIATLGFAAALSALAIAPASANTTPSSDAAVATRDAMAPSGYCGCGRYYVRYYRVVPVRYVYRYRVIRYYY